VRTSSLGAFKFALARPTIIKLYEPYKIRQFDFHGLPPYSDNTYLAHLAPGPQNRSSEVRFGVSR